MSEHKSGYISHRSRNIPIIWDGEHAQHIAEEHIKDKSSHPLLHVRIQQLAKSVKEWNKAKKTKNRYESLVIDKKTNLRFLVIIEISNKFTYIITCYRR